MKTTPSKPLELRHLEYALGEAATKLQEVFGEKIKVSLQVEGISESVLHAISDATDEPLFIVEKSYTLVIPQGRDELVLHNQSLPF